MSFEAGCLFSRLLSQYTSSSWSRVLIYLFLFFSVPVPYCLVFVLKGIISRSLFFLVCRSFKLRKSRSHRCWAAELSDSRFSVCKRREHFISDVVLSPSSFDLQLPPLFSPLVCEPVLYVRLEQSPPAVPDPVLCTHWLGALRSEQLLHVLPTDLYSQEFKLNFPLALFQAQRTAAHILPLL